MCEGPGVVCWHQEQRGGHERGEHLNIVCDAEFDQTDSKGGREDLENRVQPSRGEKPAKEFSELLADDLVKE